MSYNENMPFYVLRNPIEKVHRYEKPEDTNKEVERPIYGYG